MLLVRTTPIVLPVRFVAEGQTVQCATRDLSVEGVFVSCPAPPRAGTLLSLRLYLPAARAPEELAAVIRQSVGSGEPRNLGFWAEFAPGNEDAQERIAQLLQRVAHERGQPAHAAKPPPIVPRTPTPLVTPRMTPTASGRLTPGGSPVLGTTPGAGVPRAKPAPPAEEPTTAPIALTSYEERRREERVPSRAPVAVRFGSLEEAVLEYAANISAGGIFVRMTDPPPLDTTVVVQLLLPDGGPPAEATGVVVHRLDPAEAGVHREPGAGVQFVAPDATFRARIERFLDWALAQEK